MKPDWLYLLSAEQKIWNTGFVAIKISTGNQSFHFISGHLNVLVDEIGRTEKLFNQ